MRNYEEAVDGKIFRYVVVKIENPYKFKNCYFFMKKVMVSRT